MNKESGMRLGLRESPLAEPVRECLQSATVPECAKDLALAMMEAFERRKMSCEAYWTKPSSGALAVGKR